jgi:hypothetical protein
MIALGTTAALAATVGTYAVTAMSAESGLGFGPQFMNQMGHMGPAAGNGPGARSMGMDQDTTTMAELAVTHDLFVNNDKITRTVTNLPDGISTLTESSDPRIAGMIKSHVADMGKRVAANDNPGLPIESDALRSIYSNYDKIQTRIEVTANGVAVVQTSTDRETVAALQQHASEVTGFVKDGMAAMQTAMMKTMSGMMHHATAAGR